MAEAQAQPAPTRVFALIIANNRSLDGSQPDLQYADDDGARYFRLMQAVSRPGDVQLMTSFDRASAGLYAEAAASSRPATSSEVLRARDRLVQGLSQARARGERTALYLIFAGHGAVIEGRGMLELEDRRIDGAFLENELLEPLAADARHVILDSCNSFFVMNPRKPGGRRWATPRDMALGFSARHPDVGLFLSTNSESEVFEWSELESGVFSHEVRSGLSGGADIDGDGSISYLELAGFVEQANAGIERQSLRPHLFFWGPHGNKNAPLFSNAALRGRRVELSQAPTRLWIKDARGERLADVHKEAGALSLVLPSEEELTLYVQESDASGRSTLHELNAEAGSAPVRLEELRATPPRLAARGGRLFGELFTRPYGPTALAAYATAMVDAPAPVFGVSTDDQSRMHHYLTQVAGYGRSRRVLSSTFAFGYAGMAASAAIALASSEDRSGYALEIGVTSGFAALFLGMGLNTALRPSDGERALESFERELKLGPAGGARALAETELWLERMARRARVGRKFTLWTMQVCALVMVAIGTATLLVDDLSNSRDQAKLVSALWYSGGALVSAYGLATGLEESAAERMLRLYRSDSGQSVRVSPSLTTAGAGLRLSGSF